MPEIRILPEVLASQVAAGEVVERPASAVKELVENSLDAGAREVRVEIRRGGAAMIRVSDDGHGMTRDNALRSLERHATSKLASSEDLRRIRTLGFRGEAVPSVASVSRFRLLTCAAGEVVGTEIQVDGGEVREVRDAGCAPGTSIELGDLFFNVPARRKFLRSEATESAHIDHQIRLHALAASGVGFRFIKDGRAAFELPAGMSRLDRVRWMLGTELGGELIPIDESDGRGVRLAGLLLPARHARKGRRHQCVFLNGRPVEDAAISRGLAEGFRGGVGEGLHPMAWLWLELDPERVDVNVHPAKREIRLHRAHEVRDRIAEAVAEALRADEERRRPRPAPHPAAPAHWTAPQATLELPRMASRAGQREEAGEVASDDRPGEEASPEVAVFAPPEFRRIGELHRRYALLESEDGLVLLDPRAARERIHYERWLAAAGGVESQALLVPLLIEPGPRECARLLELREPLAEAGFEIEDFGQGTLRLAAVPTFLSDLDARDFLLGWIEELEQAPRASASREWLARSLARQAARMEPPRPEEAEALLAVLFRCELPYCAPDGRPTLSEYPLSEIDKRFGGRSSGNP